MTRRSFERSRRSIPDTRPGSSGALLRRSPLRTVRATHRGTRLKQPDQDPSGSSPSIPLIRGSPPVRSPQPHRRQPPSAGSRRLTCPSARVCVRLRSAGPPAHVSALIGPGLRLYPASYPKPLAEEPAMAVPVSCRLSTRRRSLVGHPLRPGGWAFLTVGLPDQVRTPSGFPRSAHARRDRGGRPVYPGTAVLSQPAFPVPAGACRIPAALPLPHWRIPSAGLL